ncbi:ABC transporter permease [Verrucosispora sp. FIM060022]|uniref:ABC transporter permease n=1 Tax=Verrucosispora sp. FIM060022 TaxID=1479020 RepID=UPI000F87B18E|nr:ABC transporter permease [Verrucosispora sp. FIM060022]RUL92176.1 ABC transporter permease [Verrucosispora sp. FIM060022]
MTLPFAVAAPRRTPTPVVLAAVRRSTRAVLRSPALLVAPVAQSLFFLLVYAGQLSTVGSSYLPGTGFIAFLLPLILLTGVATGAGAAGTLVLRDITSGYLDRLRLAHGSTTPFLVGPVGAALVAVVVQMVITVVGATVIGYRPQSWPGVFTMLLLLVALGLGVALLSTALAIRSASASTTGLVPLAVFGLSFFTGVFAPVDELATWMRLIATVNPLTYIVETARQLGSGDTLTAAPVGVTAVAFLAVAGIVACALALRNARKKR